MRQCRRFFKMIVLFRDWEVLLTVIMRLKNRLIDRSIMNSLLCINDCLLLLKCPNCQVFLKSWYHGRSTSSEWASKFVNRFTSGWPSLVLVSETHWRIRWYLQNFEIPEYLDIQAVKCFEQSKSIRIENTQGH